MKVTIKIDSCDTITTYEEELKEDDFMTIYQLGYAFRKAALAAGYGPELVNQIIDESVVDNI